MQELINPSERRESDRVSIMSAIQIQFNAKTVDATALNISRSGIAVWGPHPAPKAKMQLNFSLDGDIIGVEGKVAREFMSDGGSVWGIEFANLSPELQGKIDQFCLDND